MNHLNSKSYGLDYLKLGILLFFAIWFFIAFLTNVIDLCNFLHITNQWQFHSGNYLALKTVTAIYDTPTLVLNLLFFCDILIQGISAVLFFIAFLQSLQQHSWSLINIAFSISMALWATFLILEEIFIAYTFEATHMRLLTLEMIALLTMHLLPSKYQAS